VRDERSSLPTFDYVSTTTVSPNALMRKKAAADYLGIAVRTLDHYMKKGVVPYFKIAGKSVRFRTADLDSAMEKFRVS
jgi:excisionase family DNA binding protein